MHDAFEWWAEIWIPVFVGMGTIAVAVVASVVSWNAARIAHRLEQERAEDQERRDFEAAQGRLREMSTCEARILRRWVVEATRSTADWYFRSRPLNEPPPPRSPLESARVEAIVELEQSLVPAAAELLKLTTFDLKNRSELLPEFQQGEPDDRERLRVAIHAARDARTLRRIGDWGLDPTRSVDEIHRELAMAEGDPDKYLTIGPTSGPTL